MDNSQARALLGLWRRPEDNDADPQLAEARQLSENDHALRQHWLDERQLDQAIAGKLEATSIPADLRARLLESRTVVRHRGFRWSRALAYAAAAVVVLGVFFSSWRGPFQPNVSLADYRDEMVGFIRIAPNLAMETHDLSHIQSWLAQKGNFSALTVPSHLQKMEPLGCRMLRFRGSDVALICFRRESDSLVHLFVVDRKTFPRLRSSHDPIMGINGSWRTATWEKDGKVYLLTVQGDEDLLRRYLSAQLLSAFIFAS